MDTNLSLDGFRATRTFEPRPPATSAPIYPDDEGYDQPVLVYDGYWIIGLVTMNWPGSTQLMGKYHLQLGRKEVVSDDLAALEELLYQAYLRG